MNDPLPELNQRLSLIDHAMRFCLHNKLVVAILTLLVIGWGIAVAPFDWKLGGLERNTVAVDAIPNVADNQQIIFTSWPGHAPQIIEDQVTYPLAAALQGIQGVRTVRSRSLFGFSMIYIIFNEGVEFYWSRSRVIEKLNSLPPGMLPEGVQPMLGPEATALGQVFWYTLEGRDPNGKPAGGWDLHELRSIQDWQVRYALQAAPGVAEVASIGGFVQEYQVDIDPDALRAHGVRLEQVTNAVRKANIDVGAKTIENNGVEYFIRGIGFLQSIDDIENTVILERDNVPITIKHVANVSLGPALRRGALDKDGAEAVGGVVVAQFGANPLDAIKNTKKQIERLTPALPTRAVIDFSAVTRDEAVTFAERKGFTPYKGIQLNHAAWVTWFREASESERPTWLMTSQVTIVPFYDRTKLIHETLGTLETALIDEILVTIIVVMLMVVHLRSSLLISGLLPLSVLMCFIAMKLFGVTANIVALSGIAIAIGTMVDMGIVICENILRHLERAPPNVNRADIIFSACREVGGAVLTAVATTIISFLPIFWMSGQAGKLFRPLAFTKVFALISAIIVALTIIPPAAQILFRHKKKLSALRRAPMRLIHLILLASVVIILTRHWMPIGPDRGFMRNAAFISITVGGLLLGFYFFRLLYPTLLRWCLSHKLLFAIVPSALLIWGLATWLGVDGIMPKSIRQTGIGKRIAKRFPGLGSEFMPALDEGAFLYMPSASPHASIGEALDILKKQDMAFRAIPEVSSVVGKIGRVDSALDPAPVSMVETVINYKSEYKTDRHGRLLRFQYNDDAEHFVLDENSELVEDPGGRPFRQWRDHIRSPNDIWQEIEKAGRVPGATSAPKLQPIETRRIMLQTGFNSPLGLKIGGPDLKTIERVGIQLETILKKTPGVAPETVRAARIIGKPYFEIVPKREAMKRYGLTMAQVQEVIDAAIGGRRITTTVEGRERYAVRVRYMRELRDQREMFDRILVGNRKGVQIPLGQIADVRYVAGPQNIKSEDAMLTDYVTFDGKLGMPMSTVVRNVQEQLAAFDRPAGVDISVAGTYESQVRANRTLLIILPVALLVIFLIIYLQFKRTTTTIWVFLGVFVAWAGGFLMIWLYWQPWFLNFSVFGLNMRDLFQVGPINMSVAVWVGFLALFGIATDDGVVIATYLEQRFAKEKPGTIKEIRAAVEAAGKHRIRACLMTTATTILALLPVLTSRGRGADVMVPMAIPVFGGMCVELITLFVVPVLYSWTQELRLRFRSKKQGGGCSATQPLNMPF
jgi:copper/silver efflux system protein